MNSLDFSGINSFDEYCHAANITTTFVRSQFQVAIDSEKATGRKLTAVEVADAFGMEFLAQVQSEGWAPLPRTRNAAGELIRLRREQLGISLSDLACRAGMVTDELQALESGRVQAPIRVLEKICRLVNLDERRIGVSGILSDPSPNLRLRYFSRDKGDEHNFSTDLVFDISEIFWVFRRSMCLRRLIDISENKTPVSFDRSLALLDDPRSWDYSYPAWKKGEALAENAREKLGLTNESTRFVLCDLLREKLGLIIIPVDWPEEYAGATLSVSGNRAVAINFKGMNRRENTLRFTLAHELGHILCDNDDKLDHLRVSRFRDQTSRQKVAKHDLPELRANSFAAAFLMPEHDIKSFALKCLGDRDDLATLLQKIQIRYGVSVSAARYRLKGLGIASEQGYVPSHNVDAREGEEMDRMEIDENAPLSRNGEYLSLLKRAAHNKLISTDTFDSDLQR